MSERDLQTQLANMAEDALRAFNKARANGEESLGDYHLGYRAALCDVLHLIDTPASPSENA